MDIKAVEYLGIPGKVMDLILCLALMAAVLSVAITVEATFGYSFNRPYYYGSSYRPAYSYYYTYPGYGYDYDYFKK